MHTNKGHHHTAICGNHYLPDNGILTWVASNRKYVKYFIELTSAFW